MKERIIYQHDQEERHIGEILAYVHRHIAEPQQDWRFDLRHRLALGWDAAKGMAYFEGANEQGGTCRHWEDGRMERHNYSRRWTDPSHWASQRAIWQWSEVTASLMRLDERQAACLDLPRHHALLDQRLHELTDLLERQPWGWNFRLEDGLTLRFEHSWGMVRLYSVGHIGWPYSRGIAQQGEILQSLFRHWPDIMASAWERVCRAEALAAFSTEEPKEYGQYFTQRYEYKLNEKLLELHLLLKDVPYALDIPGLEFVSCQCRYQVKGKFFVDEGVVEEIARQKERIDQLLGQWDSIMEQAHRLREWADRQDPSPEGQRELAVRVLRHVADTLQRDLPEHRIGYCPDTRRAYRKEMGGTLWSDGTFEGKSFAEKAIVERLSQWAFVILPELER